MSDHERVRVLKATIVDYQLSSVGKRIYWNIEADGSKKILLLPDLWKKLEYADHSPMRG